MKEYSRALFVLGIALIVSGLEDLFILGIIFTIIGGFFAVN